MNDLVVCLYVVLDVSSMNTRHYVSVALALFKWQYSEETEWKKYCPIACQRGRARAMKYRCMAAIPTHTYRCIETSHRNVEIGVARCQFNVIGNTSCVVVGWHQSFEFHRLQFNHFFFFSYQFCVRSHLSLTHSRLQPNKLKFSPLLILILFYLFHFEYILIVFLLFVFVAFFFGFHIFLFSCVFFFFLYIELVLHK